MGRIEARPQTSSSNPVLLQQHGNPEKERESEDEQFLQQQEEYLFMEGMAIYVARST